ncbi:hypothetical protein CKF54_00010 [Psittacicella hinzii]|uniref:DNA-3-methyladenine glycosylase I n=1 Tax=Psittacicella hinzii TaxID=2028575 RepID=A0A3A1Y8B5_9GAMM|nr:DNA-3-methyladenine glycosylase I [Psittacicella hinzii]RIY34543.1 hypothetical protein CKF54_00010 [Psittacicella hinzii]
MTTDKKYWCDMKMSDTAKAYHDQRWGRAITNKQDMFAMLMLECWQAGLSWEIILRKEQALNEAFFNWDCQALTQMSEEYMEKQMANPEIIRHLGKIKAMRTNAQAFIALEKQGIDFATWVWQQVDFVPQLEVKSDIILQMSRQLKKWGFKFVGTTTVQSFLEAVGVVNPHAPHCPCFNEIALVQVKLS